MGNATGNAISDVLFGRINPSGRLSLTFPKRLEDVPSHGHFGHEHGTVFYGEDLFVGYKHFHHRKIQPQWAFGHGLSYTTFSYSDLVVSAPERTTDTTGKPDLKAKVSVKVTNTGKVPGNEIVQVYVAYPDDSELTQVPLALKAFRKLRDVQPGETRLVEVVLDKYAVSYWEERILSWTMDKGDYTVYVGSSSENLPLKAPLVLSKKEFFEWNGL